MTKEERKREIQFFNDIILNLQRMELRHFLTKVEVGKAIKRIRKALDKTGLKFVEHGFRDYRAEEIEND